MKKASIITLVAGAILLVAAFAWGGFSFRQIGNDFSNMDKTDNAEKHASFTPTDIKKIHLDMANATIHLVADKQATNVTVDYYQTKYTSLTTEQNDGTLTIKREDNSQTKYWCIWRCIGSPKPVVVTIPASQIYDYDVTTSNAQIDFHGELKANSLRAVSNNGGLNIDTVTVLGALSLQSSNAHTTLNNVEAKTISSQTNNGGATLRNIKTDSIKATASNAHIDFDNLQANTIDLNSSNGGVSGTIVGKSEDYSMDISASNGSAKIDGKKYDSALTSSAGHNKSLTVRSSNASIDINFVQ